MVRGINGNLGIGKTFNYDFDNGFANGTSSLGFGLQNSSSNNVFEFFYSASAGKYQIIDNSGTTTTTLGFTGDGLHTEFTQTGATSYTFTVSGPGVASQTFTGTVASPTGGSTISQLRNFDFNQFGSDTSSDFNTFYNSPIITLPTFNGQAGAAGNFSTATNWAAHTPVNGGSIAFDGGTGVVSATNDNLTSVYNVAFNATGTPNTGNSTTNATTYVIGGNALTINGGIDNNSTSLQTINNNLTLGASQNFNATNGQLAFGGTVALGGKILTVNDANNVVFSNSISGNGDIIASGAGVLTLSASNSFTGDNVSNRGQVFITNGTVVAGNNNALGTQVGSTSVDLGDSNPIVGSITHNSNNVALLANSGVTIGNQIYVDTNTGGSTRTIGSSGTTGATIFTGNVLLTGTAQLTAAVGGPVTFSGTLGTPSFTAGGITTIGAGTVNLTGSNGFTGATNVNSGTLVAGAVGALGGSGTVNVNTGGTLLLAANGSHFKASGTAAINVASGATFNTGGVQDGYTPNGTTTGGTYSNGIGALTLTGGSVLDFGTGNTGSDLFASSLTISGSTVSVYDWVGQAGTDNGAATNDRLLYNGPATGAVTQVNFYSDAGTTLVGVGQEISFDGKTELVAGTAVPEPTTIFAGILLVAFIGVRERRRMNALYRRVSKRS